MTLWENLEQHYVPQVYLRRFTSDGERLYVFDKIHQDPARRIRRSSVRDIGHENDFYDITQEVLRPEKRFGHNRKMIESCLVRSTLNWGPKWTIW